MQPSEKIHTPYGLLGQLGPQSPLQGLPAYTSHESPKTEDVVAAHISAMYYSALANLYIQSILPDDSTVVDDEMPRVKIALERSYNDYQAAATWLSHCDQGAITASSASQLYAELQGMERDSVKNFEHTYAAA